MLKESETEETIVFLATFLSLAAIQLGGGGPLVSPGYAYGYRSCDVTGRVNTSIYSFFLEVQAEKRDSVFPKTF